MFDHPQLDISRRDIPLHSQEVSLHRARELDVQLLNSVLKNDNVCEYGGYLTKISRKQNHTVRPATQAKYHPLLDLKPSDPSSVKTVMIESQRLISDCGQPFVIITADQQSTRLYIVDNIWATPDVCRNIYPCLGGLHTTMSFCDSLCKLMIDSGLTEILKHAFGGVEKMLSGKKYLQKVRAFRLLNEELLRPHMAG